MSVASNPSSERYRWSCWVPFMHGGARCQPSQDTKSSRVVQADSARTLGGKTLGASCKHTKVCFHEQKALVIVGNMRRVRYSVT